MSGIPLGRLVLLLLGLGVLVVVISAVAKAPVPKHEADWLIVQYTATGEVIAAWELKGVVVSRSPQSGGITFPTAFGEMHLSGNYICVKDPAGAAATVLVENPCLIMRK